MVGHKGRRCRCRARGEAKNIKKKVLNAKRKRDVTFLEAEQVRIGQHTVERTRHLQGKIEDLGYFFVTRTFLVCA